PALGQPADQGLGVEQLVHHRVAGDRRRPEPLEGGQRLGLAGRDATGQADRQHGGLGLPRQGFRLTFSRIVRSLAPRASTREKVQDAPPLPGQTLKTPKLLRTLLREPPRARQAPRSSQLLRRGSPAVPRPIRPPARPLRPPPASPPPDPRQLPPPRPGPPQRQLQPSLPRVAWRWAPRPQLARTR